MTDTMLLLKAPIADHAPRKADAPRAPAAAKAPKTSPHRRFPLWVAGVALGLGVAATAVYLPQAYVQGTNDAYIQADTITVAPKVAGYVTALHVTDNSRFRAGELLVEIDPRDFETAVASATADLQTARATKANVEQQLREQADVIAADQATIDSDRATLQFAGQQLARYAKLADDGAGTVQNWQQAQSDSGVRKASLQRDLAKLGSAKDQVAVLQSRVQQADGTIARAEAALTQARLNLSYTKIYADVDGAVANRTVRVGNYVQPGQVLFSAVPNETYVIANFKETQLVHMQVGQRVSIRVDALGGQRIEGHIDSFQRGTGAYFALLPPENATGNFVKVVQRIPVKILLDGPAEALSRIAPGMSVEADVVIRPAPRWLAAFL